MLKFLIQFAAVIARFINLFFRPLGLKNRVVIISRQSDSPTLDISLLREELARQGAETVVLTKTLQKSLAGVCSYLAELMKQMYYLATSKVVVLDGYCILVSILPKKKGQKVVQMWHALGAIKKFGWQNVDNPDGHSKAVAEAMQMHRNYDYVLAPGKVTGSYFAEAFRVPEERLVFYGLPRIDFIKKDDPEMKGKMERDYPSISEKETVLYVPTFRKHGSLDLARLVEAFDFTRFDLVLKKHFLDKGDYTWAKERGVIVDEQYSSMEWLRVCDKVITDYSAIAFEGAILDRDLYIYQPDLKAYGEKVGLNVELSKEAISAYVCQSEAELAAKLGEPYHKDAVTAFREKYIEISLDHCTQDLCGFLKTLLAE